MSSGMVAAMNDKVPVVFISKNLADAAFRVRSKRKFD